jgi:hypothetical protein
MLANAIAEAAKVAGEAYTGRRENKMIAGKPVPHPVMISDAAGRAERADAGEDRQAVDAVKKRSGYRRFCLPAAAVRRSLIAGVRRSSWNAALTVTSGKLRD